jgi:TIR domain
MAPRVGGADLDTRRCLAHHWGVADWGAFFSYAHVDDATDRGRLRKLAKALAAEVQSQTGRPFQIFVDREDIEWGSDWARRIDEGLQESTFLIPVLTPSYFASDYCLEEVAVVLAKERELGRDDLILPIYYITVEAFDDPQKRAADELAAALSAHQYVDLRDLRLTDLSSVRVRRTLGELAIRIRDRISARPVRTSTAAATSSPADTAVPARRRGGPAPTAEAAADPAKTRARWSAAVVDKGPWKRELSLTLSHGAHRLMYQSGLLRSIKLFVDQRKVGDISTVEAKRLASFRTTGWQRWAVLIEDGPQRLPLVVSAEISKPPLGGKVLSLQVKVADQLVYAEGNAPSADTWEGR